MNNNNINSNKNGSNNATIESLSPRLHAIQMDPMEFLCRSWTSTGSASIDFLKPTISIVSPIPEDAIGELDQHGNEDEVDGDVLVTGNPFTFGNSSTSQLVMERIMSQSQDVSSLTSGRLSHSSGPLNGGQSGGSPSDSPPVSPYDFDNYCRVSNSRTSPHYRASSKTVGRWLKERREKKKEETRAHNAQLHAAISVAGVAAAVAAIAAATAAESGSRKAKTDVAVASAATLVAAQCVEAAEALGAERDHLAAAVGSAVNVHSSGDIITLTAAAATALRGAATLKARALKEVWNIAAVIPVGKGGIGDHHREHYHRHNHQQKHIVEKKENESSGELCLEENFLGQCSQEVLARGTELLKRTRKGSLHWKIVSVYIHRTGNVMLKMKSRHVAGTITKKKKFFVSEICKDVMAWPGRHLLEGGEDRRYFGLKTMDQRVIEFECRSQKEYEMWTHGVSRLLSIVTEKKESHKKSKNV